MFDACARHGSYTRAAEELGYVVSYNASSLASGRSRNVGFVVPTVGRWFFSTVLEGATRLPPPMVAGLCRGLLLSLGKIATSAEVTKRGEATRLSLTWM